MVDGGVAGRAGGALLSALLGGLGASDCERVADAFLAQPRNAISSLAYVVVGVAIIIRGRMRHTPGATTAYGALVVAVGVGAVVFHGPQWPGAQLLHDLSILLVALFVFVHDLRLVASVRWSTPGAVVAVAVATAVAVAVPALVGPLTVALLVGVVLAELVIARRNLRGASAGGRITLALVAVSGIAVLAWVLGRSGSATCDPGAVLQFHALWHVASATVLGLWWALALAPGDLGADRGGIRNDPARDR